MEEVIVDLKKDRVSITTGSEHQVEIYTDKQVEKILFYIQNQKKVSLRDRMICSFSYTSVVNGHIRIILK